MFYLFGIPVTDTVTSTWIIMAILALIAWYLGKKAPVALEMVVDFLHDQLSDVMGVSAMSYLPFLGTFFLFIAASNVLSLIPGVTNPTRDLNTPAALALVVFFSVYYWGIRKKGVGRYFRELADPIFLLPFEIIGQLTRTLSLTLRLFGNVISVDLIVAILLMLVPLIAPSILAAYGAITGLIQAYIFTVLASVYVAAGVATVDEGEQDESVDDAAHSAA
jgi:F-type H+-transporting ATPase subunit a